MNCLEGLHLSPQPRISLHVIEDFPAELGHATMAQQADQLASEENGGPARGGSAAGTGNEQEGGLAAAAENATRVPRLGHEGIEPAPAPRTLSLTDTTTPLECTPTEKIPQGRALCFQTLTVLVPV